MKEIIIATSNAGKVIEFKELLGEHYNVKSLLDYPDAPDIVEDQGTFKGNALKKAKTISDFLGCAVIADDSGICVDALNGSPGVLSARYAGEHATSEENNIKLLNALKGSKNRKAYFECCIVYYDGGSWEYFTGQCHGQIAENEIGHDGFGYDPIFKYEGKSFADFTRFEKNRVSHRGLATKKLLEYLRIK